MPLPNHQLCFSQWEGGFVTPSSRTSQLQRCLCALWLPTRTLASCSSEQRGLLSSWCLCQLSNKECLELPKGKERRQGGCSGTFPHPPSW